MTVTIFVYYISTLCLYPSFSSQRKSVMREENPALNHTLFTHIKHNSSFQKLFSQKIELWSFRTPDQLPVESE
jgi:hypothetical protein